jgi:hypothetical protein
MKLAKYPNSEHNLGGGGVHMDGKTLSKSCKKSINV